MTDFAENLKILINHLVLTGYEISDLRVKVKGYLSPEITTFFGNIFKMLCHYKSYDYCCLCLLKYEKGLMSSNTVNLVEYFEKVTRNWIAYRNASWTLFNKNTKSSRKFRITQQSRKSHRDFFFKNTGKLIHEIIR